MTGDEQLAKRRSRLRVRSATSSCSLSEQESPCSSGEISSSSHLDDLPLAPSSTTPLSPDVIQIKVRMVVVEFLLWGGEEGGGGGGEHSGVAWCDV